MVHDTPVGPVARQSWGSAFVDDLQGDWSAVFQSSKPGKASLHAHVCLRKAAYSRECGLVCWPATPLTDNFQDGRKAPSAGWLVLIGHLTLSRPMLVVIKSFVAFIGLQ